MRIALLSDIHANPVALDAVLADLRTEGEIDEYWVLGDSVSIGPDPIGVLDRLFSLENVHHVRGNTDRYMITGERYRPTFEQIESDPSLLPRLVQVSRSFAWALGMITSRGWHRWLAELPLERRLILPDATRLLGVHASPGADDGGGIHPGRTDQELEALFDECDDDLICVGHTHSPMNFRLGNKQVVNLGCVSNPFAPDLRACYAVLEADKAGYRIQHRRTDYDRARVISDTRESGHPGADMIIAHLSGEVVPHWDTWHR